MQVAIALGPLSELSVSLEAELKRRIGENSIQTLSEIASMPADEFTEVVDSYFLAPFMRIATNTQVDIYTAIKVPKISPEHRKDIKDFIEEHMKYLTLYSNKFNEAEFAKNKLKYCVEQLAAFMKHKSEFMSLLMPGFQQTTRYMQRCIIYGTLVTLCNPTEIPPGSDGKDMTSTLLDTSAHTTLELIKYLLARFRHEKLSYSSDAIKTELAVRAEKERRAMIDYFDKMTDDEKQIALTQKRLGIGRFGAERAQAAWKYSASRYDVEKIERAEMGAVDFRQMAGAGAADFSGVMDAGVDVGVGSDFDQMAADDY
jgi:hypothetical protein